MSDEATCDQCKDPTLKGIHTCPERRPETAREECNRVDAQRIAEMKKALETAEKDVCQCDEVCPHCGKKKRRDASRQVPFFFAPMPYYPPPTPTPQPPFYPNYPPGQSPGVWCGTPPTSGPPDASA